MEKMVLIKKGNETYRIKVQDLLRGVNVGGEKETVKVKIPMSPTIVKVSKKSWGQEYYVVHRLRGINRTLPIKDYGNIGSIVSRGEYGGSSAQSLLNYYKDRGGIPYRTEKGIVFSMHVVKSNGAYWVKGKKVVITRTEKEIEGRRGNAVIYPNIYDSKEICWGREAIKSVEKVEDTIGIVNQFLTSYVNADLSNIKVGKNELENLLRELKILNEGIENPIIKGNVEGTIRGVELWMGRNYSSGTVLANIYVLLMLADICGKDVDWLQENLFKN